MQSSEGSPNIVSMAEAADLLRSGLVGVIPTDTVYGLAASAALESAVNRLYKLKSRHNKPGTILGASIDQFVTLGVPRRYMTAVEHYWPNPVSFVIPINPNKLYLHGGRGTVALRIPAQEKLREVLAVSGPLMTSSANAPAQPPANTVAEAYDYFGDSVDFYVDGGDLSGNAPSTVVRIVDDAIEILRPGAFAITESGETN